MLYAESALYVITESGIERAVSRHTHEERQRLKELAEMQAPPMPWRRLHANAINLSHIRASRR
jgi:hypothetical protein